MTQELEEQRRQEQERQVDILKSQFATIFTIYIDYRSDFSEISPAPGRDSQNTVS